MIYLKSGENLIRMALIEKPGIFLKVSLVRTAIEHFETKLAGAAGADAFGYTIEFQSV